MVLIFLFFMGTYYSVGRGDSETSNTNKVASIEQVLQTVHLSQNTNLVNPASKNCKETGGIFVIKKRGDGGAYGVCVFKDNRACEEWALLRGDCPIGGRKTEGYNSEEQIYCVIMGGQTIAEPNADCILPNGSTCANIDLFNGMCNK